MKKVEREEEESKSRSESKIEKTGPKRTLSKKKEGPSRGGGIIFNKTKKGCSRKPTKTTPFYSNPEGQTHQAQRALKVEKAGILDRRRVCSVREREREKERVFGKHYGELAFWSETSRAVVQFWNLGGTTSALLPHSLRNYVPASQRSVKMNHTGAIGRRERH